MGFGLTLCILGMLTCRSHCTVAVIYGRGYSANVLHRRDVSIGFRYPGRGYSSLACNTVRALETSANFVSQHVPRTRRGLVYSVAIVSAMYFAILLSGLFAMLVRWLVERQAAAGGGSGGRRCPLA